MTGPRKHTRHPDLDDVATNVLSTNIYSRIISEHLELIIIANSKFIFNGYALKCCLGGLSRKTWPVKTFVNAGSLAYSYTTSISWQVANLLMHKRIITILMTSFLWQYSAALSRIVSDLLACSWLFHHCK